MNKIYQVICQDEYNNLYNIGFYKNLSEALPDVNDWLSVYNVKVDNLSERPGTFEPCFDQEVEVDGESGMCVYIRGFIFNKEDIHEQTK